MKNNYCDPVSVAASAPDLDLEKYLFVVVFNGKTYRVVAENLTQVVDQYPDADSIANEGVIANIL